MKAAQTIRRRAPVMIPEALGDLHPKIAEIYANRGATDPADVTLPLASLAPVSSLEHAVDAAKLIWRHRDARILIVGDFDADGATSTALMIRCLSAFGFSQLDYLVPNRFDFGYGLSPELVEVARSREPALIVTVDNGISSHRGIALAREAGIDVLVTDHHLPGETLPTATLIVNPNLRGSGFPSRNLAGVGVAFYVMAALAKLAESNGVDGASRAVTRCLDLVALGTVADVVPLDRNNRILVAAGLKRIRQGACAPGISALLVAGKRQAHTVRAEDLAFAVGPRLNAAGRLEDMAVGIETLLTDDSAEARRLAAELDTINAQRRLIEADMQREAETELGRLKDLAGAEHALCLYRENWHQGIVGLVASRVRERSHRPVFAFANDGTGMLKGSGRSIPGVHLRDLLAWVAARYEGLIPKFGGHAMAAGLSLRPAALAEFRTAVDAAMQALFPDAATSGEWVVDSALDPEDLDIRFAEQLADAGPYGQGFEAPLFAGEFLLSSAREVGQGHLKLTVSTATDAPIIDAIAFSQAEHLPLAVGCRVELVYRLEVNEFRGIRRPQLLVEQLRSIAES